MAMISSRRMRFRDFAWSGLQKLTFQEEYQDHRKKKVNAGEKRKGDNQARHRCYDLRRAQDSINNPRLAPEFGYHPSRFDGDEAGGTDQDERREQQAIIDHTAFAPADESGPQRHQK